MQTFVIILKSLLHNLVTIMLRLLSSSMLCIDEYYENEYFFYIRFFSVYRICVTCFVVMSLCVTFIKYKNRSSYE